MRFLVLRARSIVLDGAGTITRYFKMITEPFLTVGKAKSGELVHIDTQYSGQGDLVCPFCSRPLVAVRGQVKIHHFRHNGATCRESRRSLTLIPGWDHFSLSLPASIVVDLLQQTDKPYYPSLRHRRPESHARRMEDYGLIEPAYRGGYQLTETGQVVPGLLSLSKFDSWLRTRLQQRLGEKRELVAVGQLHPAHFDVEAARQEQILSATLYLFELSTADGAMFYKVGRTRRSVAQRLMEVIRDMTLAYEVPVNGRILKSIESAGHVEKYTHWKYRASLLELGQFQEYLQLSHNDLRALKTELTRFQNSRSAFTEAEALIASGQWSIELRP